MISWIAPSCMQSNNGNHKLKLLATIPQSMFIVRTTMAYQSGGRSAIQESYGNTDAPSSSNVGLSNSARGEGTTTSEIVAKLRFFNCIVCAYLILFHFLPIIMNPIRLALLIKSPTRLVLEVLVGLLSISLFTVEARVPLVAEKILHFFRKCRVNFVQVRSEQFVDLDVARGRILAIVLMTMAIGMLNHLNDAHSSSSSGHTHNKMISSNPTNSSDATSSTAEAANVTYPTSNRNDGKNDADAMEFIFNILHSTIFSVTMWILLALLVYNVYVMKEYPSYAEYRAFPHVQDDNSGTGALSPTASRRSWVSNIPSFSRMSGGGYHSVDNPIQMNV